MTIPDTVRQQNRILRNELGSCEGRPLYQWAWSETLQMPMVILSDDPTSKLRFRTDVLCMCGRNKRVHDPECRISRVVPAWEMRRLVPDHVRNCWVFARWVEPPKIEDWEVSFGGDAPYPENGYLAPFSDREKLIWLRPGDVPYPETTWEIIRAIKAFRSKTLAQWDAESITLQEKREKAFQNRLEDQVRDRLTPSLAWPGKKDPVEGSGWGPGALFESKPFGGLYGADGNVAVPAEQPRS